MKQILLWVGGLFFLISCSNTDKKPQQNVKFQFHPKYFSSQFRTKLNHQQLVRRLQQSINTGTHQVSILPITKDLLIKAHKQENKNSLATHKNNEFLKAHILSSVKERACFDIKISSNQRNLISNQDWAHWKIVINDHLGNVHPAFWIENQTKTFVPSQIKEKTAARNMACSLNPISLEKGFQVFVFTYDNFQRRFTNFHTAKWEFENQFTNTNEAIFLNALRMANHTPVLFPHKIYKTNNFEQIKTAIIKHQMEELRSHLPDDESKFSFQDRIELGNIFFSFLQKERSNCHYSITKLVQSYKPILPEPTSINEKKFLLAAECPYTVNLVSKYVPKLRKEILYTSQNQLWDDLNKLYLNPKADRALTAKINSVSNLIYKSYKINSHRCLNKKMNSACNFLKNKAPAQKRLQSLLHDIKKWKDNGHYNEKIYKTITTLNKKLQQI